MKSLVILIFAVTIALASSKGLNEEFTWTRINYAWPSNRQGAISQVKSTPSGRKRLLDLVDFEKLFGKANSEEENGRNIENVNGQAFTDYQYENNIPFGANVWRNKLFITLPRMQLGIPSTLNYVPLDSAKKHNVPLIPYPNWNINLYPDTSATGENFLSVYRVGIDVCNRLWFVDTGLLELPDKKTQVKPTELIIIDLQTDKVIQRYVIPSNQLISTTILASITIDVTEDTCSNAFGYIPDYGGYGLIVYSLKEKKSWRVSHNYFFLEPLQGDFSISGYNFQWNDGVFSVELTDIGPHGFRDMYFHSMAGVNLYKVSTKVLRNETLATRSYHGHDFKFIGDRGPLSQTTSADLHKPSGTLLLALFNQNAVGCWNIQQPLNTISIVHKVDKKLNFPSDLKIYNDKVYVLSNNLPRISYGKPNFDQVNFRIWSNNIQDAIKGTKC